MTFFIVAGRALKRLSFFWEVYKDPSKFFKARALIFIFSFMLLAIWIPMWYVKAYLPYTDIVYPQLSEMKVDSGIFQTVKKRDLLIRPDGKKIVLGGIHQYEAYREQHRAQGDIDRPVFFVKVWWFPMTNVQRGWIGQMEIDGKIIASYEEKYKDFLKQKDQTNHMTIAKILLILMLAMLGLEFIVQYIKYRQENN